MQNKKKKILFIDAFVPNPSAAGAKNSMIMLNDLGNEYDVDVAYFKYSKDQDYIPESPNVRVVFVGKISTPVKIFNVLNFPFIYPMFSVRFNWIYFFKLRKIIIENNYDLLIFNHSQTFLYAHFLNRNRSKILISRDVIAQRISRTSENKFIKKICVLSEKQCLRGPNKYVLAVSQKDCDLISQFYNIQAYPCPTYIDRKIEYARPQKIENYFVLFGDWQRADNYEGAVWFFKEVLPFFKEKINIKIIGKNFHSKQLEAIPKSCNVEYLGFVDDPYPVISDSRALISPLFSGAGVKVKVVESLACGAPVIGTAIAFEGVSSEFEKYMIEANTAEEYYIAMSNNSIELAERIALKETFIESYKNKTLPAYVRDILQNHCK